MISYVKAVNLSQFQSEIEASTVGSLVSNVSVTGTLINITTTRNLTDRERKVLSEIVVNHNANELITKEKVVSAIAFGQSIIVEVATENILLNLSIPQIIQMLTRLGGIKAMLETGSLHTALIAMKALPPDAVISKDRLNRYIKRLQDYLGVQ